MQIHKTSTHDATLIKALYMETFDESEAALVAELAVNLLSDERTLSLVAKDSGIIGHVAFSPVASATSGEDIGFILAPLAVHPSKQKQGIGSQLVKAGLDHAVKTNLPVTLVYGDPAYYGRFGFNDKDAKDFSPPYPLEFPQGWLARTSGGLTPSPMPIQCVPALNNPILW